MLDSLFLEVTELFTRIYMQLDVRFVENGYPLTADVFGQIAVGVVGLLAVSVPFIIAIKLINLVCGGLSK